MSEERSAAANQEVSDVVDAFWREPRTIYHTLPPAASAVPVELRLGFAFVAGMADHPRPFAARWESLAK